VPDVGTLACYFVEKTKKKKKKKKKKAQTIFKIRAVGLMFYTQPRAGKSPSTVAWRV
jgi:hypothetical protein